VQCCQVGLFFFLSVDFIELWICWVLVVPYTLRDRVNILNVENIRNTFEGNRCTVEPVKVTVWGNYVGFWCLG